MTAQFLDEGLHVAGKERVASVEAGTDFGRANCIENPQDIARISKKKMRQLVLEDAHDPELATTTRHLVKRCDHVAHPRELFVAGISAGFSGPG